jgi:hypothetical protein
MMFLDNDDLLVPDALQRLSGLLERHPDAPAACGPELHADVTGAVMEPYRLPDTLTQRRGIAGGRLVRRAPADPLTFGDLSFRNYLITPGQVLLRKSVLHELGAFNASLKYTEDWDLWWRITMKAGPFLVTDEPVLLYRVHGSNESGNRKILRPGVFGFQRHLLTCPDLTPEQRREARLGYLHHSLAYWQYALASLKGGDRKRAAKLAGLGARDLLRFTRDVATARVSPPGTVRGWG